MEVHSETWSAFDHMAANTAPHDQHTLQPRGQEGRQSQSQDVDWQKMIDEMDAGNMNVAHYPMFSPATSSSALFQQSPVQSIETPMITEAAPQMSMIGGDSFSFIPQEPLYQQLWPVSSAQLPTYPPAIPEHEPWTVPPQYGQHGMPTSFPAGMAAFERLDDHHQQAHHFVAGPSPMLSEGSPFQNDFVDDEWDQNNHYRVYQESSTSDDMNDADASDPCYAQLLFSCLKEAPGHALPLKELYEWIKEHSQKAKDPKSRGWQNSVRHNLSMNQAFERVTPSNSHGVKKGSLWRLTQKALNDGGVISTTRFRKDPKRKPERRSSPALQRQLSGAKGGQATRNATRQKALRQARSVPNLSARQRHLRHQRRQGPDMFSPMPFYSNHPSPQPDGLPFNPPASPYFLDIDDSVTMPASAPQTPPQVQLMYEAQPKTALSEFNFSHIDFTNGGIIGDSDDFPPDTPSLATEASFESDEGVQSMLSQNHSREATSFPMEG